MVGEIISANQVCSVIGEDGIEIKTIIIPFDETLNDKFDKNKKLIKPLMLTVICTDGTVIKYNYSQFIELFPNVKWIKVSKSAFKITTSNKLYILKIKGEESEYNGYTYHKCTVKEASKNDSTQLKRLQKERNALIKSNDDDSSDDEEHDDYV